MNAFLQLFKIKDLRRSILFIIGVLILFRLTAHIPVPGIDAAALSKFFESNQALGLLNVFSGGTLRNFSVMALGVAPYITASVIFQLLGMIVPSIEEMQKEEAGQKKINKYTRLLTVPLALLQSYGLLLLFAQSGGQGGLGVVISGLPLVVAMVSMTAGTIFLMWLGELMSEKNVSNGLSIIIFAGIVANMPTALEQALSTYDSSQLFQAIIFVALLIVTVIAVVVINEAVRNIPIQYARMRQGSQALGGVSSSLPLRINVGGMIPIMFAISLLVFPPTIAQFFLHAKTVWIANGAQWVIDLFNNNLFHGIFYFLLVFAFTFFYAAVVFKPETIAENLQKQGGFIPGIRPGRPTSEYLQWVLNHLLLIGAVFLGAIAVLPVIVQAYTGSKSLVIGGSSVIIVVSVVIDMIKQIQAQTSMHEYGDK